MVSLLFTGLILLMPVNVLLAAGAAPAAGPNGGGVDDAVGQDVGTFDGYSSKAERLWVSDTVYQYTRTLKVIGTPKKVGLLSDIKWGETVEIQYELREGQIPLVTVIYRQ
jgi:hypothetical protein